MALSRLVRYCFFVSLIRMIPTLAGFAPLNTICLFAGAKLSKMQALFLMFGFITISNYLLSLLSHINFFGPWSLFTYSAYFFIILLGTKLSKLNNFVKLVTFVCMSSFLFWIWTNFGWWLTTAFFPKTTAGFVSCYMAALPYLRNTLIGNLCCALIIFETYNEKLNTWWSAFWQKQLCARVSK